MNISSSNISTSVLDISQELYPQQQFQSKQFHHQLIETAINHIRTKQAFGSEIPHFKTPSDIFPVIQYSFMHFVHEICLTIQFSRSIK